MSRKDVTDLMVCEAYADPRNRRNGGDMWPYDILADGTGECGKVIYLATQRAVDRGYIEYGTSLRSGWLTDKGMALLAEQQRARGNSTKQIITIPHDATASVLEKFPDSPEQGIELLTQGAVRACIETLVEMRGKQLGVYIGIDLKVSAKVLNIAENGDCRIEVELSMERSGEPTNTPTEWVYRPNGE